MVVEIPLAIKIPAWIVTGFLVFITYMAIAWIYLKIGNIILDYIFIPAFSLLFYRNYRFLKNNPEHNAHERHIALILANNYMPEKVSVYASIDLKKLVDHFKKNNWAYKVHFNATKEDIINIIQDPKAAIIYIVGHGQRHGVKVSKKEILYYCELQNAPKKEFIAQLHCNHYGGKSIVEYISNDPSKSFVTDKTMRNYEIDKFIDKVVKNQFHGKP